MARSNWNQLIARWNAHLTSSTSCSAVVFSSINGLAFKKNTAYRNIRNADCTCLLATSATRNKQSVICLHGICWAIVIPQWTRRPTMLDISLVTTKWCWLALGSSDSQILRKLYLFIGLDSELEIICCTRSLIWRRRAEWGSCALQMRMRLCVLQLTIATVGNPCVRAIKQLRKESQSVLADASSKVILSAQTSSVDGDGLFL